MGYIKSMQQNLWTDAQTSSEWPRFEFHVLPKCLESKVMRGVFTVVLCCIQIKHMFFNWLVVYLPIWKIWARQLGLWHSQYMESHTIPWFQTTNQLRNMCTDVAPHIFISASTPASWHTFWQRNPPGDDGKIWHVSGQSITIHQPEIRYWDNLG